MALSRENELPEGSLGDFRIQPGDIGVLEVEDDFFYETRDQFEFSLTRQIDGYRIQRTSRVTIAGIITIRYPVNIQNSFFSLNNYSYNNF